MSYSEDQLLPLSALQHYIFCPRQCALIHLEQGWAENRLTAEGRILHERVHEAGDESRGDVRIARGVRLKSLQLGLTGVADVVEFHRRAQGEPWQPFPVEYKRGKPKADRCDEVQLCAQALCLEEMLDAEIPEGALFYGKTRRRAGVRFDAPLRELVERTAAGVHALFESGVTPAPTDEKAKCARCSLQDLCMPNVAATSRTVASYLDGIMAEAEVLADANPTAGGEEQGGLLRARSCSTIGANSKESSV